MANGRFTWAPITVLDLCLGFACRRPSAAGDYASRVAREIESQTVPPGASGVLLVRAEMKPCVIQTQWTFATSWSRVKYADWVKAQLSPQFSTVRDAPGELAFLRHEPGDTHSLTVETPPMGDSLRVRVTLCVYPD